MSDFEALREAVNASQPQERDKMSKNEEAKTVVGIRFRTAGKIYYFNPEDKPVKKGDHVIVETARGVEFGTAVSEPMDIEPGSFPKKLKKILIYLMLMIILNIY